MKEMTNIGAKLVLALFMAAASGISVAQTECLGAAEARDLVLTRQVITPDRALKAARRSYPHYEVLRANLCRNVSNPKAYVYVVTILGLDGRVLRTLVNADTGRFVNRE